MKRGSLYWVDLEPATRRQELGKTRPALIVSNSEQNLLLSTVVVVPLSSQAPEIWPLRIQLQLPTQKTSYAVIPGVRQISKTRLVDLIGWVSLDVLEQVQEALEVYLSD